MSRTISSTYYTGITLTNPADNPVTVTGKILATNQNAVQGSSPTAWTLTNQGTLASTGQSGVRLNVGGLVTNTTAGAISAALYGIVVYGAAGTVTNDGTITHMGTSGAGIALFAGGVVANNGKVSGGASGILVNGFPGTVTNRGTITGGTGGGVGLSFGGTVVNSGTASVISAAFGIDVTGNGKVTNEGTIAGTVGYGVDVTGAATLTNQGIISGAGKYGVLMGSGTVTNDGTITGTGTNGTGVALTSGGLVANTGKVSGGASGVLVNGSPGTVTNKGTITGGNGGGVGLAFGGTVVNSGTASVISAAFGVDVTGDGAVTNEGTIAGTAGYGVVVTGDAAVANQGVISGTGKYGVRVGSGTVTNNGTITGGGKYGVLLGSGTVTNNGAISGTNGIGVALLSGGLVANTGKISDGASGVLVNGSPGTVTNSGTIDGGNGGGVGLAFGGTVVNSGTASVISAAFGVDLTGIGTVTNEGTIAGTAAYGVVMASGGYLSNSTSGVITGLATGVSIAGTAETVINQGTITGTNVTGLYILGATGVVDNYGTIQGGKVGVEFSDNGGISSNLLIDSGRIIGNSGTAVQFGAGNDSLALLPGASFTGLVDGGAGTNTLELRSAASMGTVHGLGTSFTNFATLQFDSGAQWTAAGNSSGLNALAMTGFTVGDTIDLTDFAAVSESFANNELVLTGSGGAQTTLNIQGNFISSDFNLSGDGGGGSLVDIGRYVLTLTTNPTVIAPGTTISGNVADAVGGPPGTAWTLTNQGTLVSTLADGVYLASGGEVTNTMSGAISAGQSGVHLSGPGTVANDGTVTGTGAGVYLTSGGSVANSGNVSGGSVGVLVNAAPGTVTNQGTISGGYGGVGLASGGLLANSGTNAVISGSTGVAGFGDTTVTNEGTITGTGQNGADLRLSSTVTNSTSGIITGSMNGVRIIGPFGTAGTVINEGTIAGTSSGGVIAFVGTVDNSGTASSISGARYGVKMYGYPGAPGTVTNEGTISGTEYFGVILGQGGKVTNTGTASLISGGRDGIYNFDGVSTVTNEGTVTGTNRFGIILGFGGTVTNSGTASDISGGLDGVYMFGTAGTVTNNGTIRGIAGDGINFSDKAGSFDNTVTNHMSGAISGGNDGVAIDGGVGTVFNDGTIVGTSDSGVNLSSGGDVTNNGSASAILGGHYGVLMAHLGAGTGTVTNDGTIAATSASGGGLYPVGLAIYSGVIRNNGTASAIAGGFSGVTVLRDGSVTNQGTIAGSSGFGVELFAGGAVTNSGTASTITGGETGVRMYSAASGTVTNDGTITGTYDYGIIMFAGTVANRGTASAISGGSMGVRMYGGIGTLTNEGRITGAAGRQSIGVDLILGGQITNIGTSSDISGGVLGVQIESGAGTVTNDGTIIGSQGLGIALESGGVIANSGSVSGGFVGLFTYSTATVTNDGTITGTYAYGVDMMSDGQLTNRGRISGGTTGIYLHSPAIVTNDDVIAGVMHSGIAMNGGGQVTNRGTASVLSGGQYGMLIGGEDSAGTVTNEGTIVGLNSDGIIVFDGLNTNNNTVIDSGLIIGNAGTAVQFGGGDDLLELLPGAGFTGLVDGGAGINTLELAAGTNAGTITELGTSFTNFGTLQFDSNARWTAAGSSDGLSNITIAGFAAHDTIDLTGFTAVSKTFADNELVLADAGGAQTTLTVLGDFSSDSFTLFSDSNGGTDITVCYAAGTRILTAAGERTVEDLRKGDMVLIVAGEALDAQPIKWIGRRRIDIAAHPRPATVAPVRIRRGAFADNVPHRDLLVSPDHAIFADSKLICARQLINGTTILQEPGRSSVEYFHVELDAHAILFAEGLPTESYLDTGNRGFFANSGEPLELYPDLTDEKTYPTREAKSCVPFVSDAGNVWPVWQRLAERASALGLPMPRLDTTTDPELHLVTKGRSLRPMYFGDGLYAFALPKGVTEVRLVSRAGAPADIRPWLEDRRCLGVNVERIVLRGAPEVHEVPVDHPDILAGWWAVERDRGALRRWTNGDAVLPLPALAGPSMLEIRASGGGMTYRTNADEKRRAA